MGPPRSSGGHCHGKLSLSASVLLLASTAEPNELMSSATFRFARAAAYHHDQCVRYQDVGRLHDFNVNFSDLPEYPDKQTFSVYVGRSQGCQNPEVGAYFVCVMPWINNYGQEEA